MGPRSRVALDISAHPDRVLLGQAVPLAAPAADGPVIAYLRPEDLLLTTEGLPAEVLTSSFLGALRRTRVRLADGSELAVQHGAREQPTPGERVHLALSGTPVTVAPAA